MRSKAQFGRDVGRDEFIRLVPIGLAGFFLALVGCTPPSEQSQQVLATNPVITSTPKPLSFSDNLKTQEAQMKSTMRAPDYNLERELKRLSEHARENSFSIKTIYQGAGLQRFSDDGTATLIESFEIKSRFFVIGYTTGHVLEYEAEVVPLDDMTLKRLQFEEENVVVENPILEYDNHFEINIDFGVFGVEVMGNQFETLNIPPENIVSDYQFDPSQEYHGLSFPQFTNTGIPIVFPFFTTPGSGEIKVGGEGTILESHTPNTRVSSGTGIFVEDKLVGVITRPASDGSGVVIAPIPALHREMVEKVKQRIRERST